MVPWDGGGRQDGCIAVVLRARAAAHRLATLGSLSRRHAGWPLLAAAHCRVTEGEDAAEEERGERATDLWAPCDSRWQGDDFCRSAAKHLPYPFSLGNA